MIPMGCRNSERLNYTITQEGFDSLASHWADPGYPLRWDILFTLPAWLEVWWHELRNGGELYQSAVRRDEEIIGIAPLLINRKKASIVGSADVCDYLDFVVAPGMEREFFNVLLDELSEKSIDRLDLGPVRPDSTVLTQLAPIAQERGYEVLCHPEDVSLEMTLPPTWEEYLSSLSGKQRHEVRRKLRRLWEAGQIDYLIEKDIASVNGAMDIFLKMFTESRKDKADFLTPRMESFFRSLAGKTAELGLLRLGTLQVDGLPAAMLLCFDYNDCLYLYNSAYNPEYDALSVGLLSKILCIKESIKQGKRRFDFLKGKEGYKSRLGGQQVPLYRCRITIR